MNRGDLKRRSSSPKFGGKVHYTIHTYKTQKPTSKAIITGSFANTIFPKRYEPVHVYINQEMFNSKLDSLRNDGLFQVTLEPGKYTFELGNIPYKFARFKLNLHPSDSIHVVLLAKDSKREFFVE